MRRNMKRSQENGTMIGQYSGQQENEKIGYPGSRRKKQRDSY